MSLNMNGGACLGSLAMMNKSVFAPLAMPASMHVLNL